MKKKPVFRTMAYSLVALLLFSCNLSLKAQKDFLDFYPSTTPYTCTPLSDISIVKDKITGNPDTTITISNSYGRRAIQALGGNPSDKLYKFSGTDSDPCPGFTDGPGKFVISFAIGGTETGIKKLSFRISTVLSLDVTITSYQAGSPNTPVTGGTNLYTFDNDITPFDSIIIECPQNANYSNTNMFTLDSLFLNNPPTDISLSNNSIDENQSSGTDIGTFTNNDPDIGETYTYSLVSGTGDDNNTSFTINGNTLRSNAMYNYETKSSYSIRVQADDGYDGIYSKQFVININDLTEISSFTINAIANVNINENTSYTSVTPAISGTPIGSVSYSKGGTDADDFSIDPVTGVVTMVSRNFEIPVDDDGNNIYEITITATDEDNNSDDEDWTVTVADVTETPFTIDAISDASVAENSFYTSVTPSVTGTPAGQLTYSKGGEDADDFSINTSTGVVTMAARNYEDPVDADHNNIYKITITATDPELNSDSEDWTVTVSDVTETASFTINAIADASVNENSPYTSITPAITGTPIGSLTYTKGGTDADDFSINASNGVITMTAQNFEYPADDDDDNIYEITITATDEDGNSDSEDWTVTVTDIIEPASFTINPIANVNINENSAYTSVTPAITGSPIGVLYYEKGGADAGVFSINTSTGVVSMTAKDFEAPSDANSNNVYEITITATDEDGNSDSEDWTVTVDNVLSEGPPEVICLIDLSLSMNRDFYDYYTSDPNAVKLFHTKSALAAFIDLLWSNNPGQSSLGMARFPDSPQVGCDAGSIELMQTLNEAYKNHLLTIIPLLTADGGSTPLLAGLNFAMTMLNSNNNKIIVLLTDGRQNCPSSNITSDITDAYISALDAENIKLYTIGFGSNSIIPNDMLNTLASGAGGVHYDISAIADKSPAYDPSAPDTWAPATALHSAYANIIVNGLGLDCSADPLDLINQGAKKQFEIPVTSFDERICVFVSWVTPLQNYLGVKIYAPDGGELQAGQPGISSINRNNHTIITFSEELLNQPGMTGLWKLEIDGSAINGESEHYQYSVINTSKNIDFHTWFDKEKYLTGNKMKIFAELLVNGEQLKGLDKVFIKGTRPGISLGNWLTSKKTDNNLIEKVRQTELDEYLKWLSGQPEVKNLEKEAREAYLSKQGKSFLSNLDPQQLRAHVLESEYKLSFPRRIIIDRLLFNDDGRNGDEKAGDGIYTAVHIPVLEGTYHFNISAVDNSEARTIRRETQMETYVTTSIRIKRFIKKIIETDEVVAGMKIYNLILDLNDKYGNVPAEFAVNNIAVSLDKGNLIGRITSNMDGTFTQKISLPENIKPKSVRMTLNNGSESGSQKLKSNSPLLITIAGIVIILIGGFAAGGRRRK